MMYLTVEDLSNWREKSVLEKYHIKKGWSAAEIAEAANTSPALVADYLARRGLLRRTKLSSDEEEEEKKKEHSCPECGKKFDDVDQWSDHHIEEHFDF